MSDTSADVAGLWGQALDRVGKAMADAAKATPPLPSTAKAYDPTAIWRGGLEAMANWASRPQDLFSLQSKMWDQWAGFWGATLRREETGQEVPKSDRRFRDPRWAETPAFRSIRDAYLLAGEQLRETLGQTEGVDGPARSMLAFLLDQYLNAVSPTNFPMTNPEVIERTADTGGANLVAGFANLVEDVAAGRGIVQRRTSDAFRKGENIAATPGQVVFQNHLFQLIQYDPATSDVHAEPLLYVPPLVNRYYMIDLQPRSSLVAWLVGQGRTVFVVSWVNPDESHRDCDVAAYVREGIVEAIGAVENATGANKADLFGFCLGGTLIAIALGYLAGIGEGDRVNSATLIGSMVDFADMRDWSAFVHEAHLDALDAHLEKRGFIESDELQQLFSAVRANDLIWSSVVNHYLLDKAAPPSDLLYWFEDGARIPQAFLTSYNRQLLFGNSLREPAGFKVGEVAIDLAAITTPMLVIALKDDHVSAWEAVFAGAGLFGGEMTFILGGSGHNAGVINPPAANKHGYWTGGAPAGSAQDWLAAAKKHDGSWWPFWDKWLADRGSGDRVKARKPGTGKLKAIEPAPGSYLLSKPKDSKAK